VLVSLPTLALSLMLAQAPPVNVACGVLTSAQVTSLIGAAKTLPAGSAPNGSSCMFQNEDKIITVPGVAGGKAFLMSSGRPAGDQRSGNLQPMRARRAAAGDPAAVALRVRERVLARLEFQFRRRHEAKGSRLDEISLA
jgi:hypothetical protein